MICMSAYQSAHFKYCKGNLYSAFITKKLVFMIGNHLPYMHNYNPRSFFQKILSLCMVSGQGRFLIKSRLWWLQYHNCLLLYGISQKQVTFPALNLSQSKGRYSTHSIPVVVVGKKNMTFPALNLSQSVPHAVHRHPTKPSLCLNFQLSTQTHVSVMLFC